MSRTLEFYFDLGSPTAYLAHTRMPGLARRTGAEVRYRPVLLGGIFKATGNRSPVEVPAKGRHMMGEDLPRFARRYGVPFRWHPAFPINTLALMRGAVAADEEGSMATFVDALFTAMWVEARNPTEPGVLAAVLRSAGLEPERLARRIEEQAVKDRLKALTEEAVSRGVFGVPTFFAGEEMFFGQDRLDFVEEALTR